MTVANDGNVGIGTQNPSAKLEAVQTTAEFPTSAKLATELDGVVGQTSGPGNPERAGVRGIHTGWGPGVKGESGVSDGVRGDTASSDAAGVAGWNSVSGNLGRLGGGNYGVYGQADGTGNNGVRGKHLSNNNFGLLGNGDYGVFGCAYWASGSGVSGQNAASGTSGSLGGGDHGVKSDGNLQVNNGAFKAISDQRTRPTVRRSPGQPLTAAGCASSLVASVPSQLLLRAAQSCHLRPL